MCGSTLGVGGPGGAGGVILEGFFWGFTLGNVSGKLILGFPWSNLSSWGPIGTGGDRGGQVFVKILLSLVFLVLKLGKWR